MFRLNRDEELTTDILSRIIQSFEMNDKIKLQKYFDYYIGKQKILQKYYADESKPCNKVIKNYCNQIVNNYQGYIAGVPVTYTSKNDITSLMDVFQYNDFENADAELLRQALIFGVAYEICYIDEDSKERFQNIDSRECIPIYDDTLNQDLLYMIRYYKKPSWKEDTETRWVVEVYSGAAITRYECNLGFASFSLLEQVPHYFGMVPFTEFSLNKEKTSIFEQIMTLQDAYNNLMSSEIDDFEAFVDAYLVLKGVGADAEDIEAMRTNRVLQIDAEDSVEYLTKSINDTQIENMLQNINDSIFNIANSPDFNDEAFGATSGIALRYKLIGFENTSAGIVANMTKAIQKRIELLYQVMGLIKGEAFADVDIKFTRNIPIDYTETVALVNSLRGLVSDKTLLSQLPFVTDIEAELDAIAEQKQSNMMMYNFEGITNELLAEENN